MRSYHGKVTGPMTWAKVAGFGNVASKGLAFALWRDSVSFWSVGLRGRPHELTFELPNFRVETLNRSITLPERRTVCSELLLRPVEQVVELSINRSIQRIEDVSSPFLHEPLRPEEVTGEGEVADDDQCRLILILHQLNELCVDECCEAPDVAYAEAILLCEVEDVAVDLL